VAIKKISDFPLDKVNHLRQRLTDNKNLKSQKILTEFNGLLKNFGLEEVKLKDFDKITEEIQDDLPF